MDTTLQERVRRVSETILERREHCATEEATKMALIVPTLTEVFGYEVYDPRQVVPEYTVDFGTKKGEKIDYALMDDGKPVVLIECKTVGTPLDQAAAQLHRYFSVTDGSCRTAILTDGVKWRFYADLVDRNKLDQEPCFVFDFDAYDAEDVENLRVACRSDLGSMDRIDRMRELMYRRRIVAWLSRQFGTPDESFIGYLAKELHDGARTRNVIELFSRIVPRALAGHVNKVVQQRLRRAMNEKPEPEPEPEPSPKTADPAPTPRVRRPRGVLVVTRDGTRFASSDPGRTASSVFINTLSWLWGLGDDARKAITAAEGERGEIRRSPDAFGKGLTSAPIAPNDPDAPYANMTSSTAKKHDALTRIIETLDPTTRGRVSCSIETKPVAADEAGSPGDGVAAGPDTETDSQG